MGSLTFLLADNQDITRAGLRHYVEQAYPEGVAIEVKGEDDLLRQLSRAQDAIVIFDYTTLDIKSVSALVNIRARYPLSQWIAFSNELTQEAIRQLAAEDGFGILLKDNSADEIRAGIRCATRGERYFCHQISNMLLEKKSEAASRGNLTPTELEILKLIAHGKSVKEIAAERISSVHTIITHKKNIFRKIEVNNVYEATKYALHAGLVDLMEYYI